MMMASLFDSIPYQDVAGYVPPTPPDLHGVKEIELDFETDGLEWWNGHRPCGVGYCLPDGTTGYLPYRHRGSQNLAENQVLDWLKSIKNIHITNTSTKFDVHMAYVDGVDFEAQGCTVSDVAHYAALLDDHRRKFSLEALCDDLLDDEQKVLVVGGEKLDGSRMAHYHPQVVAVRCEADVRQVHKLKQLMIPQLREQELRRVVLLENEVIYPVCEMERNGAIINVELLKEWCEDTEKQANKILKDIADEFSLQFNPDKTISWVRLFQKLKLPIPGRTAKNAPSFTDELLARVDNETVKLGRRAGKIATLRSKFLLAYSARLVSTNVLRYNLQQLRGDGHGTVSGRFSAWDVNIQQVMKVIKQIAAFGGEDWIVRRLFIPGEGLWLSADADQIEYRLFAHYHRSPRILEAYKNDPHLSYHMLVQKMIQKHRPDIPYQRAKDINFAKVYGAGRQKVASMMFATPIDLLTEAQQMEADDFVQIYDQEFPEAGRLSWKAQRLARARGYVKTITGRRARFPRGLEIHKSLNRVIQGSAADIMKQKIVELHRERKHTGFKMRFTVHDEVDGDCPNFECQRRVEEILNRQSFKTIVPILWSVDCGINWADAKRLKESEFNHLIGDLTRGGRSTSVGDS